MHIFEVLRRPVVTEKSTRLQEENKYVFEVAQEANKPMIKEAVEKAFNVKVLDVNTVMMRGKTKRMGPRHVRRPDWKKAVVTLRPGDRIEYFEGV
ncbi:MAG: 50S ribosomal protein L23 [Chloroflexi bacterium]|nr:50S ribosomal protein L23 [Chloroflexota bacterium]